MNVAANSFKNRYIRVPSIVLLMLRRTFSEKVFLVLRTIGLTLAVGISAGVFIYLDALGQAALNQVLGGYRHRDLDVSIRGKLSSPSLEKHNELGDLVNSTHTGVLVRMLDEPIMAYKSITLVFDESVVPWSNARTFLTYVDSVRESAEIIRGDWPADISETGIFDTVLSEEDAEYLGFDVGDVIGLSVPGASELSIRARVSGIYRRSDVDSSVWVAIDEGLGANSASFRFTPLIVGDSVLAQNIADLLPDTELRYYWVFETRIRDVQARESARILDELGLQETVLRQGVDGFQRITSLDDALIGFVASSTVSRSLMLTVGGVLSLAALSFAALVAGQARDMRSSESGMVRARGATSSQEILLMTGENIFIASISLIIGTVIALVGVSLAGRLPGMAELTGGNSLPASLSVQSIVAAVAASAIGLGSLLLPSIMRNRATAQEFISRMARPPKENVVQRYYLDVALLGLGMAALWQLSQEDLYISSSVLGEGFSNRLALAMPAAVAAGGAIVLLRFLPIVLSVLAEGLSRLPASFKLSPAVPLALWSLARNPRSSIGLMLLIMLSASIAVVLAVFSPSLERYSEDSARYRVGADIRVSQMIVRSRAGMVRSINAISDLESVQRSASVARIPATVSGPDGHEAIYVLGVEPDNFLSASWWRNDLSRVPPQSMLGLLEDSASRGIPVPADAIWITALVKPDTQRPDSGLVARIRDSDGQYHSLTIGNLQPKSVTLNSPFVCADPELDESGEAFLPPDWCRIGIGLHRLREELGDDRELSLDFIGISRRPIEDAPQPTLGSMQIRDLTAFTEDGTEILLTSFGGILESRTAGPSFGEFGARIDPASASGDEGAILTWEQPQAGFLKGVRMGGSDAVIKVIGSRWFKDELGLSVGDTIGAHIGNRNVDAEFVSFTDFFPTFGSGSAPFLVADIRKVWEIVSIDRAGGGELVNELWISVNGLDSDVQSDIGEILEWNSIASRLIQSADDEALRSQSNALTSLGWNGYLLFGFLAITAVSALAFAVNNWTVYRLRRLELAVLKSMGLTMRQLLIMIGIEQTVIASAAVLIGSGFGFMLSSVLLPYLSGRDAATLAPPMALDVGWQVLGILLGIIILFLIAAIVWIFLWIRNQQAHIALRAGGSGV